MSTFFDLIEQLAGLTAPSVLALQGLLHVTLVQVPNSNTYYTFYEGDSELESVGKIDLRVPCSQEAKSGAFLVIDFRDTSITLEDFENRFGFAEISDLSHHHPSFIGYSATVSGRRVGMNVDSAVRILKSISIDYTNPPNKTLQQTPATDRRR